MHVLLIVVHSTIDNAHVNVAQPPRETARTGRGQAGDIEMLWKHMLNQAVSQLKLSPSETHESHEKRDLGA
jgi:hypothetical protein